MNSDTIQIAIADLVRARWPVRSLRRWCCDEAQKQALHDAVLCAIAEAGGDSAHWRVDVIAKDVSSDELSRLGYLDFADCGEKFAAFDEAECGRFIDALSRLIATDGYLIVEGQRERLSDRFTREPTSPAIYRPTAFTLDLSFLG